MELRGIYVRYSINRGRKRYRTYSSKESSRHQKKMMAAFCVMAGIAILIVAVTTGFYELKFRALAAGLYNIDENQENI